MKILLQGYYGKGNSGDDVLMATSYHLLRDHFQTATISLVMDENQPNYPAQMLEGITIERPNRQAHYDMIVHGGGGVFFDFGRYPLAYHIAQKLLLMLGQKQIVALENVLRRITGLRRVRAAQRIGLGIGVGTFSAGSPRVLYNLPILAEMKALWVRDGVSRDNLKRFAPILSAPIIEGSDLAFLHHYWMPQLPTRTASDKPRVGIILRDWPEQSSESIREQLNALAHEYQIAGFILDAASDTTITSLLSDYPIHIWQPAQMTIADFAANIAAQDMLITSRAHGAICGACLGVPSLILPIEPKLEQVHAMLPQSTRLLASGETWAQALTHVRRITQQHIQDDVARNRTASQRALTQITGVRQ